MQVNNYRVVITRIRLYIKMYIIRCSFRINCEWVAMQNMTKHKCDLFSGTPHLLKKHIQFWYNMYNFLNEIPAINNANANPISSHTYQSIYFENVRQLLGASGHHHVIVYLYSMIIYIPVCIKPGQFAASVFLVSQSVEVCNGSSANTSIQIFAIIFVYNHLIIIVIIIHLQNHPNIRLHDECIPSKHIPPMYNSFLQ